jgi:hypothetical protein
MAPELLSANKTKYLPSREVKTMNEKEESASCKDFIMKFLPAIIAAIVTVLGGGIAALIANTYQSKMSATTLISQREQAESQLRATMFKDLIGPIIGTNDPGKINIERERLLVELLALNFGEHFEFKPLLVQIDERLAKQIKNKKQPAEARESLRSVARRVSQRQIALLLNEGTDEDKTVIEYLVFSELPKDKNLHQLCRQPVKGNRHSALFKEIAVSAAEKCSPLFDRDDIENPLFLSKLHDARDPLSKYLKENLSPDGRKILNEYDNTKPISDELQKKLLDDLNNILTRTTNLYEEKRFAYVKLTKKILDQIKNDNNLEDKSLVRLNRILLDAAYSEEIEEKFLPGREICIVSPDKKYIVTVYISDHDWIENTFKVHVDVFGIQKEQADAIVMNNSEQIYQSSCRAAKEALKQNLDDMEFKLTWFDFPLTDNTLLADGNRFALVLDNIVGEPSFKNVSIRLIWFPKVYFTPRERPINYADIRSKLGFTQNK